jgi:hypothetical protein
MTGHGADHRGPAPARELGGHRANRAEDALDEDGGAVDGAVGEHGAVRGDPGDAQAGAEFIAEVAGQGHGQVVGDDGVPGGGSEGPVGLRAVDPHALPQPGLVDSGADGVDDADPVAVRDHPREGHRGAEPAAPLLGITGVNPGNAHPDADLPRAGIRDRELADRSTSAAGPCWSYQDASMNDLRGSSRHRWRDTTRPSAH